MRLAYKPTLPCDPHELHWATSSEKPPKFRSWPQAHLEVAQQHSHFGIHLLPHLLKHHRPHRVLHQSWFVLLEEVVVLIPLLPLGYVLRDSFLDGFQELAVTKGGLFLGRRRLGWQKER